MLKFKTFTVLFVAICGLGLATSCSRETRKALWDLWSLQKQLIAEYGVQDVNLTIKNGNTLGIKFINSPFNALGEMEKEEQARDIATFAKDNYGSIDRIDTFLVAFVIQKQYALVVNVSDSRDTFFFTISELEEDSHQVVEEGGDEATASVVAVTVTPQPRELVSLLKGKKYELLEARLIDYQKAFEADFRQEKNVDLAFLTFFRTDPSLETYLNGWISQYPRSYAAYLARGVYYIAVGFRKRGTHVASETTDGQFKGMRMYLGKAEKDLTAALEINPQLMPAYAFKIFIPMAFGLRAQTKAIIDEALARNPYNLSARWSYFVSLEPRWGGSSREMKNFIKQARRYSRKNPELKVLDGRVYAAMGDDARTQGKALSYYNKALAHGDHWYYYRRRGEIRYHLRRYQEAIIDLDKALEIRPGYPSALKMRGFSYWGTGNYEKSLVDLNAAIEINPTDAELINARGELHYYFQRYKSALEDCEWALRLSPWNATYKKNREKALAAINHSH